MDKAKILQCGKELREIAHRSLPLILFNTGKDSNYDKIIRSECMVISYYLNDVWQKTTYKEVH